MKKITILIADDHQLIRQTWSSVLKTHSEFTIVGECGSGEEAIEMAKNLRPDIVLMDINLPGMNGIAATQQIRKFSPGTRILGISLHKQPTYAKKMMQKGALGYITKNSSQEEMFMAIQQINKGNRYICNEIKDILSDQLLNDSDDKGFNSLSQRELEVIGFLKGGFSSKEIADKLTLSAKTVEVHRYNILKKLNLKNTPSLVHYFYSKEIPD
jgi:two-component system invasion response regulator UvrY